MPSPVANPSAACCRQGAGRHPPSPMLTPAKQTVCGCHVCPRVWGSADPTHHVLSRACCFSCSSRFRLSTSTFSSMFCGVEGRWIGHPHAFMNSPQHRCPRECIRGVVGVHNPTVWLQVLLAPSGTGGILACWC